MIYNSKFFEFIGLGIWIFGFIFGIVLGFVYRIIELDSSFYIINETFNWRLMLYLWVGAFILGSIFMFFYSIIYHLETQNDQQSSSIKSNQEKNENYWICDFSGYKNDNLYNF
ncbi:MAG: hypothetical protein ACOCVF_03965 [bacterium]